MPTLNSEVIEELKSIANEQDKVCQLIKSKRKFIVLELLDIITDIFSWGGLIGTVEPEEPSSDELVYLVTGKDKIFLVSIKDNKLLDLTKLEDWELDTKKEINRFTRGSHVYKMYKTIEIY